jgi:hypothetical protein
MVLEREYTRVRWPAKVKEKSNPSPRPSLPFESPWPVRSSSWRTPRRTNPQASRAGRTSATARCVSCGRTGVGSPRESDWPCARIQQRTGTRRTTGCRRSPGGASTRRSRRRDWWVRACPPDSNRISRGLSWGSRRRHPPVRGAEFSSPQESGYGVLHAGVKDCLDQAPDGGCGREKSE